ncbi:MAG: type II toxin-antitoxin system HicA family toxin [Phycisphaerae bacterium]
MPRDLSGTDLVKALGRLDYRVNHQTGSHLRLATQRGGEHHVTVPAHQAIKIGTLNAILGMSPSTRALPVPNCSKNSSVKRQGRPLIRLAGMTADKFVGLR